MWLVPYWIQKAIRMPMLMKHRWTEIMRPRILYTHISIRASTFQAYLTTADELPRRNFTLIVWHHHSQTPIPNPINHASGHQSRDIIGNGRYNDSNREYGRSHQQGLFRPSLSARNAPVSKDPANAPAWMDAVISPWRKLLG